MQPGPGLETPAAESGALLALTSPEPTTLDDVLRPDTLNHVFDPKHNLDPLIQRFGSREAAMEQIVRNIGEPLPRAGIFEVVRGIGGQTVVIRRCGRAGLPW